MNALVLAFGIAWDFEEAQALADCDRELCLEQRVSGCSYQVLEAPADYGVGRPLKRGELARYLLPRYVRAKRSRRP